MAESENTQSLLRRLFRRERIIEPDDKQDGSPSSGALDVVAAWYHNRMLLSPNRNKRYKDYKDMGEDPMISGALNLYADDSTQVDPFRKQRVWPQSRNVKVRDTLREMFDEIEIEDLAWPNSRATAQYGDRYLRPLCNRDKGIVGVEPMEPDQMERVIDKYGRLTGWKVNFMGDHQFDPWEFVHFRVIGSSHAMQEGGSIYGTSLLEAARRPYRQLRMLEDSIVIYRLEIGGQHRIFYVDVTGLGYAQGIAETKKVELSFGKKEFYNPNTREFSERFQPLYLSKDIFWPVRKESASRVEFLGTDPNITGVADLEFIRYNLHAALAAPRAFLGGDEYQSAKYGLSQIYIVFSRLTSRLQRSQVSGYERLGQIHLALRGIDPMAKENAFRVCMMQPSSLEQEQRLEVLELATELALKVKQAGEAIGADPEKVKRQAEMIFFGLTPYDLSMIGQDDGDDDGGDSQLSEDLYEQISKVLEADTGLRTEVEDLRARLGLTEAGAEVDYRVIGERGDAEKLFPGEDVEVDNGSIREDYVKWIGDEELRLVQEGQSSFGIELDAAAFEALKPYLHSAAQQGSVVVRQNGPGNGRIRR